MILYQIYSIENAKHKLLYISLLSLCIVAFIYEGQYLGCSPNNCTLEQNEKALNNKNGESVACQETKRVNWRRSFLLAFAVFVFMNNISSFETNLFSFILMFFVIYFYFNFDIYHRFSIACEIDRKKS